MSGFLNSNNNCLKINYLIKNNGKQRSRATVLLHQFPAPDSFKIRKEV
jgi:hypothetical protein